MTDIRKRRECAGRDDLDIGSRIGAVAACRLVPVTIAQDGGDAVVDGVTPELLGQPQNCWIQQCAAAAGGGDADGGKTDGWDELFASCPAVWIDPDE